MADTPSLESDLRAITALNQHDVNAVLASDLDALISQWTDDFVVIPPAGPIVRGRRANVEAVRNGLKHIQAFEPIEFVVDFAEITIVGDYAFEWGTFRGTSRPRAGGDTVCYRGKLLRILQRQADGAWKMHRSMTVNDPLFQ
jgi:ketosteroid isomerase-like protein